jgi:hypothetical protein
VEHKESMEKGNKLRRYMEQQEVQRKRRVREVSNGKYSTEEDKDEEEYMEHGSTRSGQM